MDKKTIVVIIVTALVLGLLISSDVSAQKTLKIGVSCPLSGGGSAWGMEMKWSAEEVCKRINKAGGVTIKGQTYMLEPVIYDNKYTSAEGSKVAQKLIYSDKVQVVIGAFGTPPIMALQNITEKEKIVIFETSWSKEANGIKVPYSFLQVDNPWNIFPVVIPRLKNKFPHIQKVAITGPNDESGWGTAEGAKEVYEKLGIKIVNLEYYDRTVTEMYPIVTKLLAQHPDIVDLGGSSPGEAALILKVLWEMKYSGIKLWGPMPGWRMAVQAAGKEVVEGLYGGLAPDYKGVFSTPLQRELADKCERETGVALSPLGICAWDAMMAVVEGWKQSNSLDNTVLCDTLPKIIFESHFGPMAIGHTKLWGRPCQLLNPVCISQIKDGKLNETWRVIPDELKERLSAKGIDWTKYYPK